MTRIGPFGGGIGSLLVALSATGISVTILEGLSELGGKSFEEAVAELVEVALVHCADQVVEASPVRMDLSRNVSRVCGSVRAIQRCGGAFEVVGHRGIVETALRDGAPCAQARR